MSNIFQPFLHLSPFCADFVVIVASRGVTVSETREDATVKECNALFVYRLHAVRPYVDTSHDKVGLRIRAGKCRRYSRASTYGCRDQLRVAET